MPSQVASDNYYVAFGLKLRSSIELPLLTSDEAYIPDVEVSFHTFDRPPGWDEREPLYIDSSTGAVYINFRGEPLIQVLSGKYIFVNEQVDATQHQQQIFILASSLAAILMQRKYVLLHGAAIVTNGEATLFLGRRGIGKSTLAAAHGLRSPRHTGKQGTRTRSASHGFSFGERYGTVGYARAGGGKKPN